MNGAGQLPETLGFNYTGLEKLSCQNHNKRYDIGVWQLPPSLDGLETDAEKAPYLAIGESDRMTLVFVKPAS